MSNESERMEKFRQIRMERQSDYITIDSYVTIGCPLICPNWEHDWQMDTRDGEPATHFGFTCSKCQISVYGPIVDIYSAYRDPPASE